MAHIQLDKKEIKMSEVFHLGLTKAMLKGAKIAIVPGDPARSERIAKKNGQPRVFSLNP